MISQTGSNGSTGPAPATPLASARKALAAPIVSIDGLELKDFDYIDIGAILDTSGAVAVVIKSLVFPENAGVGKDRRATPKTFAADTAS